MTTLYADASALGRAYLPDEPGSAALYELLFGREALVVTSELARVELAGAVAAAARAGRVRNPSEILDRFDLDSLPAGPISLLELDRETALPAAYDLVQRFRLRALDAIHLAVAAAEAESEDDLVFVTRDSDQAEAARTLGLGVL